MQGGLRVLGCSAGFEGLELSLNAQSVGFQDVANMIAGVHRVGSMCLCTVPSLVRTL